MASAEDAIAESKTHTVRLDRAEGELRPLLIFKIDQTNFETFTEVKVNPCSWRNDKVPSTGGVIRIGVIPQANKSFDIWRERPSSDLRAQADEVGTLCCVSQVIMPQPTSFSLNPDLPPGVDIHKYTCSTQDPLPITGLEESTCSSNRDIGAGSCGGSKGLRGEHRLIAHAEEQSYHPKISGHWNPLDYSVIVNVILTDWDTPVEVVAVIRK